MDAACKREDIIHAFDELTVAFADRRAHLWNAYLGATRDMLPSEYRDEEDECWHVLCAGLTGIDAEERIGRRDFDMRMAAFDRLGEGAAA